MSITENSMKIVLAITEKSPITEHGSNVGKRTFIQNLFAQYLTLEAELSF